MSAHRSAVLSAPRTITGVLSTAVSAMVVAALAVASGCSTHRSAAGEVSKAIDDWERPSVRLDGGESEEPPAAPSAEDSIGAGITEEAEGHGQRFASPSPLQAYVQEALERNPSVRAAAAAARAELERIAQVTSLPDPVLRAIVRPEPVQTAAGDMYLTLGVGQMIPLPAKLDGAGRAAAAGVRMAIERLNAVRLSVIARVEQAYYRLYLTDRGIELTEAHRRSLEELEPVLASQYRAGGAEQQDLLRIQTEIAKLRDDENRLGRQRASAAAALNQLLDHPPARELAATRPISLRTFDTDVEQLIALAAAHNPELAAFTHRAQRDREEIELARLAHWPDAMIGFEWTYTEPRDPFIPPINPQTGVRPPYNDRSAGGDDNWALTLQLNLPIWLGRIEAAKREARERLHETQHEKQAVLNMITFRVFDAWVRVQTQQETIRLLESTLIPQAKQTYDVSLTSYQAGKTDFLTVIDNWRRLLDFELMLHREVADLEIAFSELQRQVGLQLEEMGR